MKRRVGRRVFGTDIAGYDAGRLDYPPALFGRVFDQLPERSAIAEIGPGTGIATASLLEMTPERLVGFEPDRALADYLRARFAGTALEIVQEDFCSAPASGPFDLIVAAASFHWLDPRSGLERVSQMLRGAGRFALWWNVYRQIGIGDLLADAITPLLEEVDLPPSDSIAGHYALDSDLHQGRLRDAGFTQVRTHCFRRERTLSAGQARALYASYSFVRCLDQRKREYLLRRIEQIVEEEFNGSAPNVVLTPVYIASLPLRDSARRAPRAGSSDRIDAR